MIQVRLRSVQDMLALVTIVPKPLCQHLVRMSPAHDGRKLWKAFYGGGVQGAKKSKEKWEKEMPFCGEFIARYYRPCVPKPAYIGPDLNYPLGRFTNHTVREKDRWIEMTVKRIIQQWTHQNLATSFRNDQQPLESITTTRFTNNLACQAAFTQYMCWINFPRCDEFEESLPTCQSACENFFRVCGYSVDFLRCGSRNSGKEWSRSTKSGYNGTLYTPNFFPGQPFKSNEFIPNTDVPKAVCTPSIKGSSSKITLRVDVTISLAVLISIFLI